MSLIFKILLDPIHHRLAANIRLENKSFRQAATLWCKSKFFCIPFCIKNKDISILRNEVFATNSYYQMITTSGYQDIWIRQFSFVAKRQFLCYLKSLNILWIRRLPLDIPEERDEEELVLRELPQVGHDIVVGHRVLQDGDNVKLSRSTGHITESRKQDRSFISWLFSMQRPYLLNMI